MSLQNFISHIRETGLPTASHYLVEFNKGEEESVQMLVDQVNFPGVNIMTTEMRTFGEITESAYGVNYNPVTISVLIDNKGNALKFFHDWADQVYNRYTRFVGYRADYAADMTIKMLDRKDGIIYKLILQGAYPKTISDIQMDATSHDVMRLNVTFIYNRWTQTEEETSNVLEGSAQPDNIFAPDNLIPSTLTFDNKISLRDWGSISSIPKQLSTFGPDMGSSLGRTLGSCTRSMLNKDGSKIPLVGADSADHHDDWKSSLNNLTSNFVNMGEGLGSLGKSLSNVVAPVTAIAGSVSAVSGTLGAMDSTLQALGLGSPFSKIRNNLNATAGKLGTVAQLKGVPGHLGTIGANMGAIGGTFKTISGSIDKATNAPKQMKDALNKLGANFERQGQNLTNGSSNLDNYAKDQ